MAVIYNPTQSLLFDNETALVRLKFTNAAVTYHRLLWNGLLRNVPFKIFLIFKIKPNVISSSINMKTISMALLVASVVISQSRD